MSLSSALEAEKRSLLALESARKDAKCAAFRTEFKAREVKLEALNGAELVLVDDFVFYETAVSDKARAEGALSHFGPRHSRPDGPGFPEYSPGRRFVFYSVMQRDDLTVRCEPAQDLTQLARLFVVRPEWAAEANFLPEPILAKLADVGDLLAAMHRHLPRET